MNEKVEQKMPRKKSTLAVMTKTRELTTYVFDACEKAPRKYRFSLCMKVQNYCLDALENIYLANSEKDLGKRISYQEKAKVNIAMLDYFFNLAYELQCFTFHQYEVVSLKVAETLKLMIAWLNSTKRQEESLLPAKS